MLNWVKRIQEEDQFNITFISIGPTAGIKESPELSAVLHTSTSHTFNIQTRARYWWDFRSGANVESTVAANSLVPFPASCLPRVSVRIPRRPCTMIHVCSGAGSPGI